MKGKVYWGGEKEGEGGRRIVERRRGKDSGLGKFLQYCIKLLHTEIITSFCLTFTH